MDLVLRDGGHLRVPLSYKFCVLIHLVRLDLVKDDRMDIFAASQHLRKAALNIFVKFATFGSTVDEG
jgi:hypothetical protein